MWKYSISKIFIGLFIESKSAQNTQFLGTDAYDNFINKIKIANEASHVERGKSQNNDT